MPWKIPALSAKAENCAESLRLTRIHHRFFVSFFVSFFLFCQNPQKGLSVEWQVWGSHQSKTRGSITLQAVSGITPELRTSCMAPNPPFLDSVLAISKELSVWEMTVSYSFRQKEKSRHCPEGETSGAIQESCCKAVCGVETMKHGCWILMM